MPLRQGSKPGGVEENVRKTKAGHRAAAAATGGTSNLTHRRGTFIGLWWSRKLFDAQAWCFATREAVANPSGNSREPPVTPRTSSLTHRRGAFIAFG